MSLSKEEKTALAVRAYADPVFFCLFFLPHLFGCEGEAAPWDKRPCGIPWFQRAILAILTRKCAFLETYGELEKIIENFVWHDSNGEAQHIFYYDDEGVLRMNLRRYTEIIVPRGYAKTTTAGVAVPLYEILFEDVDFTAYVSHAAPHAKMQLDNVKRELLDNDKVKLVFGEQKPKTRDAERWSSDFFETVKGMAMAARGRGGQIRGLLHRGHRPRKIIVDDLEDMESVSTPEQREKVRTWFYGDLEPALPRLDDDATIVLLGTLLHREALIETLARDERWTTVRLAAVDANGEALWPEMFTLESLESQKEAYAAAGLLHVFYMEYMNQAVAPEQQVFVQEFFIIDQPKPDILTGLYCDPAISKKRTADHVVIVGGGISPSDGRIYVTDVWGKRGAQLEEIIDQYFALQAKLKSTQNGMESNAFQQALVEMIRAEMFKRGQYFEIEPVTNKTKKTERIRGVLRVHFYNGRIVFQRHFPRLEGQLLDFRPDLDDQADDYPDALAGFVKMLDPYAAASVGDRDLSEDEYEPLEEDFGVWAS